MIAEATSNTAAERANPPPRRKSCEACMRAKRRCDLGFPACMRCANRGIQCRYPASSNRPRPGPLPRNATTATTATSCTTGAAPAPAATTAPSGSDCNTSACSHISEESPPFSDFDNLFPPTSQAFSTTGLPDVMAIPQGQPRSADGLEDFLSMENIMDTPSPQTQTPRQTHTPPGQNSRSVIPVKLTVPSAPFAESLKRGTVDISKFIENHLSYSLVKMRAAPEMMVRETKTAWCHSKLYSDNMPQSMLDAHACCALYIAKSPSNSAVILRAIETRVKCLISTPLPTSDRELLARTQALLLYHIILLFDGDVRARADAEKTLPELESTTLALLPHVSFEHRTTPSPSLYNVQETERFWRAWLFDETSRRTLYFAFYFVTVYRALISSGMINSSSCERSMLCRSWTLSAPLWDAQSSLDFALAWNTCPRYVVTVDNIVDVFGEVAADDVDDFGKILMTSFMGIEQTRAWFFMKGSILV